VYLSHLPSIPRLLLAGGTLLLPAVGFAEQVAIEHKDVACFVAGQFPVLDACFNPGPGLARARVFFRPEGATTWYYVEAKTTGAPRVEAPNAACRKAILPKPKKQLLKKHVEYYVEATGQGMETSQTETYRPLVVQSEGECKNKLVAPFVPTAAVQVFPALPAAFAAGSGLSTVAVAAVVTAGVAGTTGAVVAATNGGSSPSPAPTLASSPSSTLPPVTVPTTTATTTLAPAIAFNPVFKVFRAGVLEPGSTIAGTEPIPLRFLMCESTGPAKLKFNVLVNGVPVTAGCDTTITFSSSGFAAGVGSVTGSSNVHGSSGTLFNVVMQIQSDAPGNDPKSNRALVVDVSSVPTTTTSSTTTTTFGCGIDTTGPTNTNLATPKSGQTFIGPPFSVDFTSFPTDPSGIDHVDYYGLDSTGAPVLLGTSFTPTNYLVTVTDFLTVGNTCQPPPLAVQVFAKAFDLCGNITVSPQVTIQVQNTNMCSLAPAQVRESSRPTDNKSGAAWVSQLDVPEGRGQVVLNSSSVLFPGAGRVALAASARSGENRVEATLVQAAGKPGLWRFELAADHVVAGSLRVIAGPVALVTGDEVVFKMKGQPGERVVFTFRSR
jgi:hypothetical protein